MLPSVLGMSTYHVLWGAAILLWLIGGWSLATRAGFDRRRAALALAIMVVAVLVGAKGQYLFENPSRLDASWVPLIDAGLRLPGGIVLASLVVPLGLRALRLPLLTFVDVIVPLAGVSLALGRIGCFLHGCCFGMLSTQLWAVRFPPHSRPQHVHYMLGMHAADGWSMPVHPLQLYYVLLYLGIALLLVVLSRRASARGLLSLWFAVLWAWGTFFLEPLRSVDLGRAAPVIQSVALGVALALTPVLVGVSVWRMRGGVRQARAVARGSEVLWQRRV